MRDTIDMAREAGIDPTYTPGMLPMFKAFEALVRADEREQGQKWFDAVTAQHKAEILAEREACAKVCEQESNNFGGVAEGPFVTDFGKHTHMSMAAGAQNCAAAIRARETT